jgi:hypothetical protein
MTDLGQTNDPTALVPGEPAMIYQAEGELRNYGDMMAEAGTGLQRVDTSAGWSGDAADAFRKRYHGEPDKWTRAGGAFHSAADALNSYAGTLSWAQQQAATAINQWNDNDKQTATSTLDSARSAVRSAGDTATIAVGKARDLAPPKPGFWSRLGSDVGGFFSDVGHDVAQVGEGTVSALASYGNSIIHDPASALETIGGAGLTLLSAGGEVGGFALDATGIGSVLGVPANVISAAGIATGLGLMGAGAEGLSKDASGSDSVNLMQRSGGGGGGGVPSGPADGVGSWQRPPVEGDTNYVVRDPNDSGRLITDIDDIDGGRLVEEKTATGADPRMNIPDWVQTNVTGKLDSYREAQQYMPGYENAPLGLRFTRPGATPQFKAAVQQAVDQWEAAHPGVPPVEVDWAS